MCIQCGCPIQEIMSSKGKLIIKAQLNPVDTLRRTFTFDIYTTMGEKLCTIEPGMVETVEINRDVDIWGKPTYGFDFAKENRKTNTIRVNANRTTRIQLAFVPAALGISIKAMLHEVDVIDSE